MTTRTIPASVMLILIGALDKAITEVRAVPTTRENMEALGKAEGYMKGVRIDLLRYAVADVAVEQIKELV